MIATRHILSAPLAAKIVKYLEAAGNSSPEIARLLGVPESFVVHLKKRRYSLTRDHVSRLIDRLGMSSGEFFIAVSELGNRKRKSKLHESFVRSMRLSDRADASMLRALAKPRKEAS